MVWKINFTPLNVTIFITRVHNCVKGAKPMFAIGGTFQIRTHIINISKGEGKDKELMQSSTTPDTSYYMGKRQKHKKTSHTNHSQFHRPSVLLGSRHMHLYHMTYSANQNSSL